MKLILLSLLKLILVFCSAKTQAETFKFEGCDPFSFRALIQSIHNPTIRAQKSLEWLKDNGDKCSIGEITDITSNLSNWLGPSLSAEISGVSGVFWMKKYHEFEQLKSTFKSASKKDKKLLREKLVRYEFGPISSSNIIAQGQRKSDNLISAIDDEDEDEDEDEK